MHRARADADVFRAIADPTRRALLDRLRAGPAPVNALADEFAQSRPAISKHLRVLREAGLVEERRSGTQRLYTARTESIAELRRFLESFWDEGLHAIKHAAETGSKGGS